MMAPQVNGPNRESLGRFVTWFRGNWGLLLIGGLALWYFVFVAHRRIVDDDEAYYILAGRQLFTAGQLPYRDFFFPQMPLSAVIFGLVDVISRGGLVAQRTFGAFLGALSAVLIFSGVRRSAGTWPAVFSTVLFCFHILTFLWVPLTKTFALTIPMVLGAFLLAADDNLTPKKALIAGLLMGLCVSTRLPLAALVPVLGLSLWLLRPEPARERRHLMIRAGLGTLAGLAPALLLFAAAPRRFWFCNVTYHAIRSGGDSLVHDWPQKWKTLLAVLGVSSDGYGTQTVILLLAAFAALGLWRGRRRAHVVFAMVAVTMAIVGFLPSPIWDQYFVMAIPPSCVVLGLLAGRMQRLTRAFAVSLAVFYAIIAWAKFEPHIVESTLAQRPGIEDSVSRLLRESTREGDVVASHWPGYLVAARRKVSPLSLNQFAFAVAPRLTEDERREFHVPSEQDLRGAISRGEIQAFVVGREASIGIATILQTQGWTKREGRGATVWTARR